MVSMRRKPGLSSDPTGGRSAQAGARSGIPRKLLRRAVAQSAHQTKLACHANASGKGFGLTLSFKRATDALLLAASFAVASTQDTAALATNPEFRRADHTMQAAFSSGFE